MTDPFDRFERQVRDAMRAAAPPVRRRWRPVRGAALGLAGVLVVSGGALAATRIAGSGQSPETQGRKIALRAVQETRNTAACRLARTSGAISDAAPLPEIVAALPLIAAPADPASVVDRRTPGRILRSSVHRRELPGGFVVTVYVEQGAGLGQTPNDPAGCRAARLARAEELLDSRSQATRNWALRRLDQLVDVAPGAQTLWILTKLPGRPGAGGAGIPVRPGRALRAEAVASSTDGARGSVYTGLAGPGVTSVRVLPERRVSPFRRRAVDGLYVVRLPNQTGRAQLQELDEDGDAVRTIRLR